MNEDIIKDYCTAIKAKANQGDFMGGLAIADRLAYSFPQSEKGHYFRGVCFFGLQRYGEAVASYKMALNINPLAPKVYFNLATCYQQLRQYDLALIAMGKALILFSKQHKEDYKMRCIDALNLIEIERNRV